MEETKEAKAARKEFSAMEEAKAKCKKYSTETMMGKFTSSGFRSGSDNIGWTRGTY